MGNDVRERMVDGAMRLLATQGLQRTSFAEITELVNAPRGSIYHYFPGGKNQVVAEALRKAGDRGLSVLARAAGRPAVEVAEVFIDGWRTVLAASGQRAGCAVAAVALSSGSAELRDLAGSIFGEWLAELTRHLQVGGVAASEAAQLADELLAGCEGAVVLARATADLAVYDRATAALLDRVRDHSA